MKNLDKANLTANISTIAKASSTAFRQEVIVNVIFQTASGNPHALNHIASKQDFPQSLKAFIRSFVKVKFEKKTNTFKIDGKATRAALEELGVTFETDGKVNFDSVANSIPSHADKPTPVAKGFTAISSDNLAKKVADVRIKAELSSEEALASRIKLLEAEVTAMKAIAATKSLAAQAT